MLGFVCVQFLLREYLLPFPHPVFAGICVLLHELLRSITYKPYFYIFVERSLVCFVCSEILRHEMNRTFVVVVPAFSSDCKSRRGHEGNNYARPAFRIFY